MPDPLTPILQQWTRLGVMFDSAPARHTPDIERLLLATARHAPSMARLFVMATTWLSEYSDVVARHRLVHLIRTELDPGNHAALGLLLSLAQVGLRPAPFATITRLLTPHSRPRPLFDIEAAKPLLIERARSAASSESLRWGLWCAPITLKPRALRPPAWIMQHNPALITRADFRGDLRASILASLLHDDGAGTSELHLARACGGSRAQVRAALRNLELTGRVQRLRLERRTQITATAA